MKADEVRRRTPPVDATSNAHVERKSGDFLLLASTLAMIGWCVPLAIAFEHMPRGAPLKTFHVVLTTLALLLPIAITCGAVGQATVWIVKKGATPRGRKAWRVLLLLALLGSGPGYFMAFVIAFAGHVAEHGMHN